MKIQTLAVGELMTNCYILCDEQAKVCAVVDPGGEAERIAAAVEKTGCALQYILLTHGHYDHFTGVAGLLQHYDVPVYIHPDDAQTGGAGNPWALKFPALDEKHQRWYGEGDVLTLGSLMLHVLSTPGHSWGSVCIVVENVIFAGDTLFCGSCGRTDFPGGDYKAMLLSLARLARLEGSYTVYPGHDRATDLERERRMNPYMRQGLTLG